MRKEIKTVIITCDICGQETSEVLNSVSESCPTAVVSIRHDIWYGGVWELQDFCRRCQGELVLFLEKHHAVGRGKKVS